MNDEKYRNLIERYDRWSAKPYTGSLNQQQRFVEFSVELRNALEDVLNCRENEVPDDLSNDEWSFPGVVKTWPIVGDE